MKYEQQDHVGNRIEIRQGKLEPELLNNGRQIAYGRLPDGKYFLHEYAHDWTDNLLDLARRYIDHAKHAAEVRSKNAGKNWAVAYCRKASPAEPARAAASLETRLRDIVGDEARAPADHHEKEMSWRLNVIA